MCKTPEAAAEVTIQPLDAIGTEALVIFNDILVPLELLGAEVTFDDKGPLISNPVTDGAALARLPGRTISDGEPIAESIRIVRRRVGKITRSSVSSAPPGRWPSTGSKAA
jgi:uroporphyrinogen decarboxylase